MKIKKKIVKGMAVTLAFTIVPSFTIINPTKSAAETTIPSPESTVGRTIYVTNGSETSTAGQGTENNPYVNLRYAIDQATDGDTIILKENIVYRSNNMPLFEINKNVVIDGNGYNLTIRGSHIILKKDAVFRNISLNLLQDGSSQAKIYANGHSLTFDGVSTKIGTNVIQDIERPAIYGGGPNGNTEGPKTVIKIINGNQESRFKKIVAGSETGDSNVPVNIIIDNKAAKVDEGIVLGGENGSITSEVTLSSNSKAVKKIDGTNAPNNSVELKGFTSYSMELSGIQNLSLKDNTYLSSGTPINISGKLDLQNGSTLALTSHLPNNIDTLSGEGKIYIGEDSRASFNNVDIDNSPIIEFGETLDELNNRNAISPVITTSKENFEKLNLKLVNSDEPLKMENGSYSYSQPDRDNSDKVRSVQELYDVANNLKAIYDNTKVDSGIAISQDDANNINQAKDDYEETYIEASAALENLEENLKSQVNTYGLTPTLDSAVVNDIDDNNKIDVEEVNLVNELFTLAKSIKDSYDQAKNNVGLTINMDEANLINTEKTNYTLKYTEAIDAFNNLSEVLKSKVNKQELPIKLDEVVPNDIDNNDVVDTDEINTVNEMFELANVLKKSYDTEVERVGSIVTPDEAISVNSKLKDYIDKYNEADAAYNALDSRLQPQIDKKSLSSTISEISANDKDENGQLDSEQIKSLQSLFDEADALLKKYNKEKLNAGTAYSQADVDNIAEARKNYNNKLTEALNIFESLIAELKSNINHYDLSPITESLPIVNDKNNNEIIDDNELDNEDNGIENNTNDDSNSPSNNSSESSAGNNSNINNDNEVGNTNNSSDSTSNNEDKVNSINNNDNKTIFEEKFKNNISKKESKVKPTSPKTDDDNNIVLSFTTMIGAIITLLLTRKKTDSK